MSADPLVIDGMRAVELARLTQGLPGWPGLHRHHVNFDWYAPEGPRGWVPVSLAAAENDLAAGWDVDCYAYPVPRGLVAIEEVAATRSIEYSRGLHGDQWLETVEAALRGSDEAIYTVACALARRDRDELAHG